GRRRRGRVRRRVGRGGGRRVGGGRRGLRGRRGRGGRGEVRVGRRLVAAGARVAVGAVLRGLVERDGGQAAVLVGRRGLDLRNQRLQERVGGRETGGLAVRARGLRAVVAAVGDDVGDRRRGVLRRQVEAELVEPDHVARAVGVQRVEVDE